MFQTQSVYMTVGSSIEAHKVMSCMTFDPPMPVESGIEDQVHKDKQTNHLFIKHVFFPQDSDTDKRHRCNDDWSLHS